MSEPPRYYYLYTGSFTRPHPQFYPSARGRGISVFKLTCSQESGESKKSNHSTISIKSELIQEIDDSGVNPGFITIKEPNSLSSILYASYEGITPEESVVTWFKIRRGKLEKIGRVASGGRGSCHVLSINDSFTRTNLLSVTNYISGCWSLFQMDSSPSSGNLAQLYHKDLDHCSMTIALRQEASHPHSTAHVQFVSKQLADGSWSNQETLLLVADLGGDRVYKYILKPGDSKGNENTHPAQPKVEPRGWIEMPPGFGPRHIAVLQGKYSENPETCTVFILGELANQIKVFSITAMDLAGEILLQTISTLPPVEIGDTTPQQNLAADIHIHPNEKFLFASNRGHNSIVSYKIDQDTKLLNLVGFTPTEGKFPRNFLVEPIYGRFILVANKDTDNVVVLQINQKSGTLWSTGCSFSCDTPTCLAIIPSYIV